MGYRDGVKREGDKIGRDSQVHIHVSGFILRVWYEVQHRLNAESSSNYGLYIVPWWQYRTCVSVAHNVVLSPVLSILVTCCLT